MQLEGVRAIVTGGASGLGRAVAEYVVQRGGEVVVFDLPTSAGERTVAELGPHARFVGGDVGSEADVARAVTAASPFRVLVCCAGVAPPGRVLRRGEPLPLEEFTRVVQVNLVGTFNALRLAAAAMAALEPIGGERGVIVTTSSIAAFEGQVGQAAYAASKAGVAGMTISVARDLADVQIRVCAIAPGIFDTPMLAGLPEAVRSGLGSSIPHPKRLGLPSEFARLVGHVIENPMLNGATIRIDGALRLPPR